MMYAVRDAEGKFVGRSRSAEAAHRASRSQQHLGATVNRAGRSKTREEWIASLQWNIKDATEALNAAVGMQKWASVIKYAKELDVLEGKLARATGARPRIHRIHETMQKEMLARKYPESEAERAARIAVLKRRGYSFAPGYAANRAGGSLEWHSAAKRYLERLGAAEWKSQGEPKPRGRYPRRQSGYVPTEYHRSLIEFLNKNDEEGFKALKLQEGYASALGV